MRLREIDIGPERSEEDKVCEGLLELGRISFIYIFFVVHKLSTTR